MWNWSNIQNFRLMQLAILTDWPAACWHERVHSNKISPLLHIAVQCNKMLTQMQMQKKYKFKRKYKHKYKCECKYRKKKRKQKYE